MDFIHLAIAFVAALLAGFTNAVAGGGTLITFPVLVSLGLPPIVANVTNTVALCPGIMGGVYAQRHLLKMHRKILLKLLAISVVGGIIGSYILLHSDEKSFKLLIPFLILFATGLLAMQNPVKKWVVRRISQQRQVNPYYTGLLISVFIAAIYGGYFGAGLGVILLAVLGVYVKDELANLNLLKQVIALGVNLTAAIYFVFSGPINWWFASVMAVGALLGGYVGGSFIAKLNGDVFKWMVVAIGTCIGMTYLVQNF